MSQLRKIETQVTIRASREKVWDAMYKRFGETYLYNPSVEKSHFVKGGEGAVGCERQCDFDAKTRIVERIVSVEELKRFQVDIFDGNMPMLEKMLVDIKLNEGKASGLTTVTAQASFSPKPAFMGGLMSGMMKSKLHDMLIGLKYYLETGRTVSKENYKPIKKSFKKLQFEQTFV